MPARRTRRQTQDVPANLGILVVDTKGFSKHPDAQQNTMITLIPTILEQAARRADLAQLWTDRRFPDSTGDGYIIGFDQSILHKVVDHYFDALQHELWERADDLRAQRIQMRMRASLNVGPVRQIDDVRIGSPVGKTMNDTHRLVDCDALRVLLNRSDPEVTMLAVAASEQVMEIAVRAGHTGYQDSEFAATTAEITAKDFTGTAYLRVPVMSGDLVRFGLVGVQQTATEADVTPPEPVEPSPATGGVSVGSVSGGVGAVTGVGNTVAGGDIDQSHRIVTAGRDLYHSQRDMTIGPHRDRRPRHPDDERWARGGR